MNDRECGRSNVVLKIFPRTTFSCDRNALLAFFSWHVGTKHPLLANLFEAGLTPKQHLYLVREHFPDSQSLSMVRPDSIGDLVNAVSFIHSRGLVHGRIRPSNLFASSGRLKLADPLPFAAGDTQLTEEDIRFVAPEVLAGQNPSSESDYYSLGVLLYRYFSRKDPFQDIALENLRFKYMWAAPKPLSSVCLIDKSLSDAIAQLVHKNPQKRQAGYSALLRSYKSRCFSAERAPIVGRETEIAKVETFFRGHGPTGLRVAVVEGQAGVGKTRFIEELHSRSRFSSDAFIYTRCEDSKENELKAIIGGLKTVLELQAPTYRASLAQELGPLRSQIPYLFSDDKTNVSIAVTTNYPVERTLNDLVSLFHKLSRNRRLTLVIEDFHFATALTVQLVRQMCYRASETPIHLIVTKQPEFPEDVSLSSLGNELLQVFLPPLNREDSRTLVSYFEESSDRQNRIVELAAGNPYFIQGYLGCKDPLLSHHELPLSVDRLVQSKLTRLPRMSRTVCQILSVFDRPIAYSTIQEIAQIRGDLFKDSVGRLLASGLAERSTAGLAIRYPSVRNKVYARLSNSRRTRLHASAYRALEHTDTGDETLRAYHAFKGRLYECACLLYGKLARDQFEQKRYKQSAQLFKSAGRCAAHLGRSLSLQDSIKLARSYAAMGNQAVARRIYEQLLLSSEALHDPETTSYLCVLLATPEHGHAAADRIELLKRAITCLPSESTFLVTARAQLSEALLRGGDFAGAEESLALAERAMNMTPEGAVRVKKVRAYLLLSKAEFRDAAELLRTFVLTESKNRAHLNNLSFCLDQMGHLELARKIQLKAQKWACEVNYVPIQALCNGNLGAIETKLGNFECAEQCFRAAIEVMKNIRRRDRSFDLRSLQVVTADAALFYAESGRYRLAIDSIRRIDLNDDARYQSDNMFIGLAQCDIYIRLGANGIAEGILNSLATLAIFKTSFYQTEVILLRARFEKLALRSIESLQQRLRISADSETVYQQCKIELELARSFLAFGRRSEAWKEASQSYNTAARQGYKPLMATAALIRGLAAEASSQRARFLAQAFRLASEIGMPELVAESAFHIGAHQMQRGHYLTAKEYLLKSTSTTTELLEQVPLKFRARYMAKSWRKEARRLLDECVKQVELPVLALHGEMREAHQDDRLFRGLYRLTVSAGVAKDVDSFASSLVQTLDTSIRRRAVVMLKRGDRIDWHPVRVKLSQELTKRVAGLSDKARGRIYFGSEKNPTKDTVAWVPFQSERHSGGVYVSCRPIEPPLAEKELEFLTILGTVASGALDQIEARNTEPRPSTQATEFHGMVGNSKVMRQVYLHVETAARSGTTVLIEGESGTGKELVAKAIHKCSGRASGPFIAVDCGAIPETLIESELFGSQKGAFTGAVTDRPGLFEAANKGTIFLDEIGNTTPSLQAKLLRVIQEREIRRIGETRARPVDVRLIAATNCDLDKLVQEKRFRSDLLYRLKVLHITLPALRNRREDIPHLAQTLLDRLNAANKTRKHLAAGFFDGLSAYNFPGNVRELQNIVERSFFLSKSTTITGVAAGSENREAANGDDVSAWFNDLIEGRKSFWSAVQDRYKKRDISREKVTALVDLGLRSTRGSYKDLASSFHLRAKEYRRFMDFLRRSKCLLDFRPYRNSAANR